MAEAAAATDSGRAPAASAAEAGERMTMTGAGDGGVSVAS